MGVVKIASEYTKLQCSCIHWLRAWMTATATSGSSATRSSSTLASGRPQQRAVDTHVLHHARRVSGSKKASLPGITFGLTPLCPPIPP